MSANLRQDTPLRQRNTANDLLVTRPDEPEFRGAQRANVHFEFSEDGEKVHDVMEGWARIDGPWLHFYGVDCGDVWQSWPMTNIVCVEWEVVDAPAF